MAGEKSLCKSTKYYPMPEAVYLWRLEAFS